VTKDKVEQLNDKMHDLARELSKLPDGKEVVDDVIEEVMTGWDDPETTGTPAIVIDNPGKALLKAIAQYIEVTKEAARSDPAVFNSRFDLLSTMRGMDWDAVGFALEALSDGEDLFRGRPESDVILKYKARNYPQAEQEKLDL
jgi:hypothetical protein